MSVLAARDLVRNYPMNGEIVHALRGVSLSVEAGEYVAIAGPSGSGKSTLLQLIGGIDQPTSGSVEILGTQVVPELRKIAAARKPAHVPDAPTHASRVAAGAGGGDAGSKAADTVDDAVAGRGAEKVAL